MQRAFTAQMPPGTGWRTRATQPTFDPEMEAEVVSTSGNRRHGPQVRELRPQGPGTLQQGKPAMGTMDGNCLVSAGLHRAMSPMLT